LYWGVVSASAVAFSGATDFMHELNRLLHIVKMEGSVCHFPYFQYEMKTLWLIPQFKVKLANIMVANFIGCWVIG
jgi:cation-transporting ATPase 13A1